jgi:hypothetical protein
MCQNHSDLVSCSTKSGVDDDVIVVLWNVVAVLSKELALITKMRRLKLIWKSKGGNKHLSKFYKDE